VHGRHRGGEGRLRPVPAMMSLSTLVDGFPWALLVGAAVLAIPFGLGREAQEEADRVDP